MKGLLFLVVVLIYGIWVSKAYEGNCYLEDVREINWMYGYNNDDVNDTHSGILKVFKSENVTDVTVDNRTYINAYMKDDEIYVYATDNFKYFEIYAEHAYYPSVDVKLMFSCTEGKRELGFFQNIIDTNNNKPHFYQDEYVFRFAMDVPKDTELNQFLLVQATDFDITNYYLEFTFDEENATEYLSVSSRAYEYGDKIYKPTIKTIQDLQKPFRQSFTLRAQDSGEPELTGSTTITILAIDPEDVVPSPVFNRSLTVGTYDGSLLSFTDKISLKNGIWSDYEILQKGLEEYISVQWSTRDEGYIEVLVKKEIPEDEFYNGYVTMEIFASNDNAFQTGRTSLLIYLIKQAK